MPDDLEHQLEAWADQGSPVTAAEARQRAEVGDLGILFLDGARGRTRRSRRLLAVAAAVLIGAMAFGVWAIASRGDGRPSGVDTVDQPGTPTTLGEPATTRAPTNPDPTTVPEPIAPIGAAPDLIVVHSADHQMQVFDRKRGATVRTLGQFDDPDADPPAGEPAGMGRYLGPFVVSPDGQTVYYETCCEPAVGEVFQIPISGGEPEFVTYGTSPAVSPDGTKLAVVDLQALKVVDLTDGTEQRYPLADGDFVTLLDNPSWSPDGTQLVLEWYGDAPTEGRVVLVTFDGGEDVLQASSPVAVSDAAGTPMLPVFDANDDITIVRQSLTSERSPDASRGVRVETYRNTGEPGPIAVTNLQGPVRAQGTAGAGRFLIRTAEDGSVYAEPGAGAKLEILGHGYLDAAW